MKIGPMLRGQVLQKSLKLNMVTMLKLNWKWQWLKKEKLNAETFNNKDKSVYFKGVKQKSNNLPDPKNKIDGKGSYATKKGKLHQKGKQRCLGNTSKKMWMFMI